MPTSALGSVDRHQRDLWALGEPYLQSNMRSTCYCQASCVMSYYGRGLLGQPTTNTYLLTYLHGLGITQAPRR
jgi:hypothetical protein